MFAAILSALYTFFNFSEIASNHKDAAVHFAAIRHEIEIFLLTYKKDTSNTNQQAAIRELKAIGKDFDNLANRAPSIPDKVYNSVSMAKITKS